MSVLITVKAYPSVSTKYGETVCVAGIRLDTPEPGWVRLFPVAYRDLLVEQRFRKYEIVRLRAQPEGLLDGARGAMRLTRVLDASPALHAALVADGWEGAVAKRTGARYRCGRHSASCVKLKSPAARDRERRRVLAPA
jgi:hypothetical protein